MPENLAHCLFSLTVCASLNAVLGNPALTPYAFLSALIAILVNIDLIVVCGRQVKTPLGHSISSAAVVVYISSLVTYMLYIYGAVSDEAWKGTALAVSVGYGSHLFLDAFTADGIGIYATPRNAHISSWCDCRNGIYASWHRVYIDYRRRRTSIWRFIGKYGRYSDAVICTSSVIILLTLIAISKP